MQYGKENEATAVKEWEDMSGIRTEKCGLFLSRDGITGATPDRLIGDDGLLEVMTFPKQDIPRVGGTYRVESVDCRHGESDTEKDMLLYYIFVTSLMSL